jgi:HD-like signal output (HDOD) protein
VAPKAWLELEALTSDPETSVRRVAAAVGKDAGLAASVLKLTNSPVNGLRRTVTSVEDATALLGVATVRRLVLGAEVARSFAGADLPGTTLEELSLRGEACGQLASRLLGPGRSQEERHLALTAGMLRDVGQLALAHLLPSELAEVREQAITRSLPMGAIEVLRWGVTHAEIGAHLLRAWGLPVTVADAVAGHHALLPSAGDAPTPAQAVALASLLMAERGGPLADPAERDEGTTLEEAAEEAGVLNALDDWRLLASVTLSAAEGAAA